MSYNNEIIIYTSNDGNVKVEVLFENETAWLTQAQISKLFQRERSVITKHIKNVFDEGELEEKSNVQNLHIPTSDKPVKAYSLEVIIAVGYRVKSPRGTQFRIWATERLSEYITKGFTLNDDLLKNAGGGNYFDELLERIRDIRSSEKVFWRKVLDIYATSIDYDPYSDQSKLFFKTVQNKMHWAAHGKTAAEVIYQRADANKLNMGLTNFKGAKPRKSDISVAKNYLTKDEIDILNRIVTAYLEIAELQAIRKTPMKMSDWIIRLDDFLKMTGNEILTHSGKISRDEAKIKAELEYERFNSNKINEVTDVEKHFLSSIDEIKGRIDKKTEDGEADE